MTEATASEMPDTGMKALRIGLWCAQGIVFALFTLFGCMKLLLPVQQLADMWVWPGQIPVWILYATGILDVAGGVGVLLPSLLRVRPRLSVLAALGCAALQIAAILFHVSRGEAAVIWLNLILLALSAFVAWGRARRVPVSPRM